MVSRGTLVGLGFVVGLLVFSLGAVAVVWVEDYEHYNLYGQHLHAYAGAYLDDSSGDCLYWSWQNNDGDTSTAYPYGHVFTHDHNTESGWSMTELTKNDVQTGEYAFVQIGPTPGPPCSVR